MGKRLIQQKLGKGSPSYKRPSSRCKTDLEYRNLDELEKNGKLGGEVIGFVDDPARSAILMEVKFDNAEKSLFIAPEGAMIGERIEVGASAGVKPGNVLPLNAIPEGMPVYDIELSPGDGGRLVRSSGTSAFIVSHEGGIVTVRLPSKKLKMIDGRCRAQVGVICGGGRLEKPFLKAGKKFYAMGAMNRRWPNVRGVAMNPYNHPFGGKEHHKGRPSTVSRSTPPGRKVGHLASRRTGRRRGKSGEREEVGE
jgi:large subunit ribosomal protein L2